jgi:hypothetical protein
MLAIRDCLLVGGNPPEQIGLGIFSYLAGTKYLARFIQIWSPLGSERTEIPGCVSVSRQSQRGPKALAARTR